MSEYTEKKIIKGCKNQDRIFQKYLYHKYSEVFLKICCRYAKDFHDAEQLLQDGFLKIFEKIKQFKYKGSFEGWMKKIIVNTCLDHLRSKQFKDQERTMFFEENIYSFTSQAEALEKIDLDELIGIIQTLPPMSRAVFNLFAIEGYPHKEVAEKLNINEGTSQWHVSYAKKILQKKIIEKETTSNKIKISSYG